MSARGAPACPRPCCTLSHGRWRAMSMIRVRQTPLVAMELKESIYASCSVAGVVSRRVARYDVESREQSCRLLCVAGRGRPKMLKFIN